MSNWRRAEDAARRQRLKRRTSIICPDYTPQAALILIATIAVGMLLWLGIARAAGLTRIMYACTEKDPLNVRERPSTHSEIVARIERGDTATVVQIKDGWALVEGVSEAGEGWVSLKYLSDAPLDPPLWVLTVEDDQEVPQ